VRGDARSSHLTVSGISKSYAERRVLSGISFTARTGDRIGLVGENGAGKSTLLRILSRLEQADTGEVSHAGTFGLLQQQLPYPDEAPIARVLDDAQHEAFAAIAAIEAAGAALGTDTGTGDAIDADDPAAGAAASAAEAYAGALERAEQVGAWQAEARRGEVLTGLGLGGLPLDRPVGELSGGQRLRLALAVLLLEAPHTILLDEPSNHLDDASAAYLERVLAVWPGIVIAASHDRALLDAITTRILDLDPLPVPASVLADAASPADGAAKTPAEQDPGLAFEAETTEDPGSGLGLRAWGVGYSVARRERAAEMRRWRDRYAAELAEREALIHEIEVGSREVNRKHESKSEAKITRKFYADKDARVTARRARNARVRLEQLERDRVRRPPEPLRFSGVGSAASTGMGSEPREPARSDRETAAPSPMLAAHRVGLSARLRPVSFELPAGGRLMLTGPNGAGKSTLLAILARELEPDRGELRVAPECRIGYLPQEAAFERLGDTAEQAYARVLGAGRAELHPLAETGLIASRDLGRAVGALSVGQRRRLALATLVADPPDLLLLDEPTNHLSLTLVEDLEAALRDFDGALIVATHDRWFRWRWEGETLALAPAAGDDAEQGE
jgi:macrolide transport system ATP-binding/permease protein